MEKTIELEIAPDGTICTVYKDDVPELARQLGMRIQEVKRLSHVEWEQYGWTVRSAHDPELAVRWDPEEERFNYLRCKTIVSRIGRLFVFNTREYALQAEQAHFWDLMPPKEKK